MFERWSTVVLMPQRWVWQIGKCGFDLIIYQILASIRTDIKVIILIQALLDHLRLQDSTGVERQVIADEDRILELISIQDGVLRHTYYLWDRWYSNIWYIIKWLLCLLQLGITTVAAEEVEATEGMAGQAVDSTIPRPRKRTRRSWRSFTRLWRVNFQTFHSKMSTRN